MSLRFKIIKIAVVFAGMIMLSGVTYADYSFSRYPLLNIAKVTATFGQFREYYNLDGKITYVGGHEGIDLDDVDSETCGNIAAVSSRVGNAVCLSMLAEKGVR